MFFFSRIQFKKFCLPVKTSCPSAEKVNETLGLNSLMSVTSRGTFECVKRDLYFTKCFLAEWTTKEANKTNNSICMRSKNYTKHARTIKGGPKGKKRKL